MLDVERKYFEKSFPEFQTRYPGKILIVKGEEVIDAFDTIEEALAEGVRRFGLESFLVRQVAVPIKEISIPALTLGILRADPPRPSVGTRPHA